MRRAAAAFTFVLLVGGLIFGSLQPASSQAPGNRITWFDPNATDFEKEINEGREAFGAGDWAVVKDRFYDPETCDRAGTFLGRFTFIKSIGRNDGFFMLDGGAITPDGKLTFHWPGRFSEFEDSTATGSGGAITGGTGAYSGAGGTVTVEEGVQMCNKKGALITVQLTP